MNDIIDILVNFGGGRGGEASGTVVRFLLPLFFWLVLAVTSRDEWHQKREIKDRFVFLASLTGAARELLMFLAEYGSYRGYFSFDSFYQIYPPLEHAATMFAGIFIAYAFMSSTAVDKRLQSRFMVISSSVTMAIYVVTATGWPAFLAGHPKTSFAMYGGDLAFRVAACLIFGFVLTLFIRDRFCGGRISTPLLVAVAFLFFDELLMIFNILTMEQNVAFIAPLRHNLHIWAIPFFIANYWSELKYDQRRYKSELEDQHRRLTDLNYTLEARVNKAVGDLMIRDWFKSGQNELNKALRGDKSCRDMADDVLKFLSGYLGSSVGAFYLYDDETRTLEVVATYALGGKSRLHERIALGDGLAGQTAVEKKTILIGSVPHDYLRIGSALGESDPLNIILVPVINNDQLSGIIELGSFKEFTSDAVEFLDQSMEAIASSLSINRSRDMVNELLKSTQMQAEMLRVQQEELQQSNEELEERTRLLEQQRKKSVKSSA